MNNGALLFFVVLGIFFLSLIAILGFSYRLYRNRSKSAYGEWENLFQRLSQIDRESVSLIALDFIGDPERHQSKDDQEELDPSTIWPLIGGIEGLESLQRNCAVLVDMAFYVQRWYPEALAVAEQLRLNAREIEWHVDRLKASKHTGKLEAAFPDYAQRAITVYYLMTRRVLTLFEQGDYPGLYDLQRAL